MVGRNPRRTPTTAEAPGNTGGFWSRQKIKARQQTDDLIWLPGPDPDYAPQPYELRDDQLGAASYNLLMGSEAYVSPTGETDPQSIRKLKPGQVFMIPPGQFAFLLTHEAVRVPDDAIGLLALRAIELKFQGLVNVSGFHVDPGYYGRLVFAVYNAGPGQVHLRQGKPLFEIFFADLDQPTDKSYRLKKKPIYDIEPRFIAPIAGEFETFKGLKSKIDDVELELEKRIQALEREQSILRWGSALIVGALVAFGVRGCTNASAAPAATMIESPQHGR